MQAAGLTLARLFRYTLAILSHFFLKIILIRTIIINWENLLSVHFFCKHSSLGNCDLPA